MSFLTPSTEWTLTPGSTEFTTVGSNGLIYASSLEELTGGKYSLFGRSIRNNATNRFVGSVPRAFDARFIDQGDGSFLFVNITDFSGVSTYGKQLVANAMSIETDYLSPSGDLINLSIPFASINRVGKRLILNEDDPSFIQYRWVDIGTENLAPGYRFATNAESINYGLSSALMRNYRNLVSQIADQGINDENGNPIETITDAANYLARTLTDNATYAHIFQLR